MHGSRTTPKFGQTPCCSGKQIENGGLFDGAKGQGCQEKTNKMTNMKRDIGEPRVPPLLLADCSNITVYEGFAVN